MNYCKADFVDHLKINWPDDFSLSSGLKELIVTHYTSYAGDPEVLCLVGELLSVTFGHEEIDLSPVALFERALEIDGRYTEAFSCLAHHKYSAEFPPDEVGKAIDLAIARCHESDLHRIKAQHLAEIGCKGEAIGVVDAAIKLFNGDDGLLKTREDIVAGLYDPE